MPTESHGLMLILVLPQYHDSSLVNARFLRLLGCKLPIWLLMNLPESGKVVSRVSCGVMRKYRHT